MSFYFISSHFINSISIIWMISTIPGAWQSHAHETKITKMPLRNFQIAHTSPGTAWRVVKAPHQWDFVYILLYSKMLLFHRSWVNDLQTIMPSVSLFQIKLVGKCWTWVTTTRNPAWPASDGCLSQTPVFSVERLASETLALASHLGTVVGILKGDVFILSSHWEDPGVDEDHFQLGGLCRPT